LLGPGTPLGDVARIVDETSWGDSDDIIRALFFHVRAFRGEQAEVNDIAHMLDVLGDVRTRRLATVSWRDRRWQSGDPRRNNAEERAEKALHRLVLLGVVRDYTVDYAGQEFAVRVAGASQEEIAAAIGRYAGAYQQRLGEEIQDEALGLRQPDHRRYILDVAARLVAFIYQHVELARRRALAEMLQAASSAQTGENLRQRILDYLQQTEWDKRLEAVRTSAEGGMDELEAVLDEVASSNDARLLRAASGRQLASYPDVPGLLVLRATAEVLSPDANAQAAREDVHAALGYAAEKYRLKAELVAAGLAQAVDRAASKDGAADVLVKAILGSVNAKRPLVRALLTRLPEKHSPAAARWLLDHLATRVVDLIG
jgi:ATP-dependent DNA helicase RecQ